MQKLILFIEKEVMPFVESHFRVNDERGIYGYSMPSARAYFSKRSESSNKVFIGVGIL